MNSLFVFPTKQDFSKAHACKIHRPMKRLTWLPQKMAIKINWSYVFSLADRE